MALSDHKTIYGDLPAHRPIAPELLQIEDELDRVQMDIDAGRFAEARAKFVHMDRALRESPRALVLRAKSSPSRDSHDMIANVARDALKRTTDVNARLNLCLALALCGDTELATKALPGSLGLTASQAASRRQAVAAIGNDPEKGPDRRTRFEKFVDRWLGARE